MKGYIVTCQKSCSLTYFTSCSLLTKQAVTHSSCRLNHSAILTACLEWCIYLISRHLITMHLTAANRDFNKSSSCSVERAFYALVRVLAPIETSAFLQVNKRKICSPVRKKGVPYHLDRYYNYPRLDQSHGWPRYLPMDLLDKKKIMLNLWCFVRVLSN